MCRARPGVFPSLTRFTADPSAARLARRAELAPSGLRHCPSFRAPLRRGGSPAVFAMDSLKGTPLASLCMDNGSEDGGCVFRAAFSRRPPPRQEEKGRRLGRIAKAYSAAYRKTPGDPVGRKTTRRPKGTTNDKSERKSVDAGDFPAYSHSMVLGGLEEMS